MVSLTILKIVYILGIIGSLIWAISLFVEGSVTSLIAGILVLIFGSLIWRVFCELLIVLFSIHNLTKRNEEHLKVLSDTVRKQ